MGCKRKAASQAAPEPRRSRRNVDKNDQPAAEEETVLSVSNGDESSKKSKQIAKSTKTTIITASTKTAKKAIIDEVIDANKEFIPIKTYGKSTDPKTPTTTPTSSATTVSNPTTKNTRVSRFAGKLTAANKPNPIDTLKPAKIIKKKTAEVVQHKKKGNLTINSPAKVEIKTTTANNVQPIQSTISTVETGGQKKIIINKIIMAPDAYNQMIKQQQSVSVVTTVPTTSTVTQAKGTATTIKSPVQKTATTTTLAANQVPVQLINNLQTSLGPLVLSSGIKVLPNLTVTNPQPNLLNTKLLPLDQVAQAVNQQLHSKNANLRIVTSGLPTSGTHQLIGSPVSSAGGLKQLQLPIIIKSIVSPLAGQQTLVNTQAKTTLVNSAGTSNSNPSKVNPISSVKAPANVVSNKTPDRVVVNIDTDNTRDSRSKRSRVSFNFDKNTSTSIKPIPNDLPITASNVLLTSTPKQSIIKKPKVFELACTPIVNNINSRRGLVRAAAVNSQQQVANKQSDDEQAGIAQQVKSKIETAGKNYSTGKQPKPIAIKYCKQASCNCWSDLPKDDIEKTKKTYASLNTPKKMLYVYCTTIKVNASANFDFEKYAFFVRTKNGFVQVCNRVYMDIFDKHSLSFVDTAFKKCQID